MLYEFCQPTLFTFMGIPGSGKTTLAREMGKTLPTTKVYLECEEDRYPEVIKQQFVNRDQFGYLAIFEYFRNMRVADLNAAYVHKLAGESSIIDCYFDKLMSRILTKNNIDWFINPKHPDYQDILKIAIADAKTLPDADVIFFLKISEKMHQQLQQKRSRKADMDPRVFYSQDAFLAATEEYAKKSHAKLFLLNQEDGVKISIQRMNSILQQEGLIKPYEEGT